MKKYFFTMILLAGILATSSVFSQEKHFGTKIDDQGAISMNELTAKMVGVEEMEAKVTGKVVSVCQAKGCWMTLDKGDGTSMRVSFTDYGFFMPKNISGKTVVIQGRAKSETTSVEEQRHYAEDAKKSKEEIAQITEPLSELTFEADGVIVK